MSGVVVEVRVHVGSAVKKGDPVAVLSAMYAIGFQPELTIGKWRWSFQLRMPAKSRQFKLVKG
jgi:Biotin-requiring enzyme